MTALITSCFCKDMRPSALDWLASLDGREFDLGFTTSMKTHPVGAILMSLSTIVVALDAQLLRRAPQPGRGRG